MAWAGLHWGLSMASLGLLISRSLYLSQSLITLVVWFGVGAPMLLAVNKIVGVLIFPALSIEDEIYTAVRQRDPTVLPRQCCATFCANAHAVALIRLQTPFWDLLMAQEVRVLSHAHSGRPPASSR